MTLGKRALSFAQQRLWFLDQLEPGNSSYNIPTVLSFTGGLNIPALQESLDVVIQRHDVLRTTFATEDGHPVALIAPELSLPIRVRDLTSLPDTIRREEAMKLASNEANQPFNLSTGPLIRTLLIRISEDEHLFVVNMHHIVSDGWSISVFFDELSKAYQAKIKGEVPNLKALPLQYADFAEDQRRWLEGEVMEEQLAYWKEQLGGELPVLDLPLDFPRPPIQKTKGAKQSLILPEGIVKDLKYLSRREGATLFMTLLAGFQTLLHRYSGQDDIIIGSPVAGRNEMEHEELIGLFLNTIVLRTSFADNPRFRDLVARIREVSLDAYAHQDVPFERLVEELHPQRDLSRNPIFDVLVNYVNTPAIPTAFPGVETKVLDLDDLESKFTMTLYIEEAGNEVHFHLVYQEALFTPERIRILLEQFRFLLEQISRDTEREVRSYSLHAPCTRSFLPNPQEILEQPEFELVPNQIMNVVRQYPLNSAIIQGRRHWSYAEFAESITALSEILLSQGVQKGEVVAITGEKSFGLIASMVAVLRTGGVMLTLDRKLPENRKRIMLEQAQVCHLVYVGQWQPDDNWLNDLDSLKILCIDPVRGRAEIENLITRSEAKLPQLTGDDAAYLFFTSGTTGVPKGVLGCHKGLSHFLNWQREQFDICSQDRCAQLTGLSFDVVLRDVFVGLTGGASLHLLEEGQDLTPDVVLPWLEQQKITVMHTVPALAQTWLLHVPANIRLSNLRYVFLAGEPLMDSLVRRWRETFKGGGGRIVNLYGPTETTMAKCFHVVAEEPVHGIQPVGMPLPQTQVLILNTSRQLCGIGEVGEITIRTPFRSLGYCNVPEETWKRFVPNPFCNDSTDLIYFTGDSGRYRLDGTIEILGRMDMQVKIRGVRIEPDEVTAVLAQHPKVKSCIVIPLKNEQGENILIAYVVADEYNTTLAQELKTFLSQQLPAAMVPSAIVSLDQMPLTTNGKVDRRALPLPTTDQMRDKKEFVAARDTLELQLIQIWEKVLGISSIGVRDDFFQLGGHSLLGVRLVAQIKDVLDKNLPLAVLFQKPTVEQMAEVLRQQSSSTESSLVAIQPKGNKPPFFCIPGGGGNVLTFRELSRHLGNDQPFFGLQPPGFDGGEGPYRTVEEMAAHFIKEIRTVQPEGPYYLGGHSFGSAIAFEMARQLKAQGQQVAFLGLLEPTISLFPKSFRISHIDRYVYHFHRMCSMGFRERISYLGERFRSFYSRMQDHVKSIYSSREKSITALIQEMKDKYMLEPYDGQATLFLARDMYLSLRPTQDPRLGWTKLANGGVEIFQLPGGHMTIFHAPQVQHLARQLKVCLHNAFVANQTYKQQEKTGSKADVQEAAILR